MTDPQSHGRLVDVGGLLRALQADEQLFEAIMVSHHPAAHSFRRWLRDDVLSAIDALGLRGPPGHGHYRWPGTRDEFNDLINAAVDAVCH